MARYYQVSLRTVFELVFVVAVILAFLYWRSQPPPEPSGRYQLTVIGTERGVFLDTKTGKAWRGWFSSGRWDRISTPVDNSPTSGATAIPSAVKTVPPRPIPKTVNVPIPGKSSDSDTP
jgi:hypothetical protein